jgi:hypothetical protein
MRCEKGRTTLTEMAIVIIVVLIAAFLVLPLFRGMEGTPGVSRREKCLSNMEHVARAMASYRGTYSDYYPYYVSTDVGRIWSETPTIYPYRGKFEGPLKSYAEDPRQQCPTDSLSLLYPDYVADLFLFGCPNTDDTPRVRCRMETLSSNGDVTPTAAARAIRLWSVFGDDSLVPDAATVKPGNAVVNPFGRANVRPFWSSYGYDHCIDIRNAGAHLAVMADMDETAFSTGTTTANHHDGAHVLCFDGHVKWTRTVYASNNPLDNIFRAERNGWGAETDSYVDRP